MTHFEDLSPYVYDGRADGGRTKNVGWLDSAHDFPTEQPSLDFLEKLWSYCRVIVNPMRGLHCCELCSEPTSTFVRNGTRLLLGSGEIRVFSAEGEVFAAPNLVYHYVNSHNYRPPSAFVCAVQDGPRPPSDSYIRLLEMNAFIWRENNPIQGEPTRFRFTQTEAGVIKEEVKNRD